MYYSKIKITLTIFVFSTFICFSQEKSNKFLPLSIYQTVPKTIDLNTKSYINKKLDLSSLKFVFLDFRNIDEEYTNIPLISNFTTPSKYIYDSYNKYILKQDLQKSFFKVSDLYKARKINKN